MIECWRTSDTEVAQLVRPICIIPRDQALLRTRSVRARSVQEVAGVIADLLDTWDTVAAYGIAAPQIGVNKRVFIFRPHEAPSEDPPTVVINPKVIKVSGELKDYDGCLSVPGIYGETRRAERIEITALDVTGREVRLKFEGFTARIIQHEMDHLDGVLFIDRLDTLDELYTLREEAPAEEGGEPRMVRVPLEAEQRALVESGRRPLPGFALRW
jgi:peptide deformylase